MTDLQRLNWFKEAFERYSTAHDDPTDWREFANAAIYRKHTGDLEGAIDAMTKSIRATRTQPLLAKETATNLNYLADLYLLKNATEQAEAALNESIELSRPRFPGLMADDLLMLARIQMSKGEEHEALASAEEARQLHQQRAHSHGVSQAEELIQKIRGGQRPM